MKIKKQEILKRLGIIKKNTNENEIFHELCLKLPFMEEFVVKMVQAIEKDGLYRPVEKYKGKILAGRHRWYACKILGIEIAYHDLNPNLIDPQRYVINEDLIRKHLSPGQEILSFLEIDKWIPKEIEKDDIIELKKEFLHTKRIAKEVETFPTYIKKTKRILKKAMKEPKIKKTIEELKKGKISLEKAYRETFHEKKPSKKGKIKVIENWKEKYLDMKSLYNKIVSYMKEKGMWDKYVKETFPIAEEKEYFGPTIEELRKSKK